MYQKKEKTEIKTKQKSDLAFHERNLRTSILSTLRREGEQSRALLGKKLDLTPAMVTRVVKRLIDENLLHEGGRSKGSGGRMCTNITLNPNAGIIIGIEYNQREIVTVAVNFAGILEKQLSFILPARSQDRFQERLLSAIYSAINKTISVTAKSRKLLGIATVDPGIIDILTGTTLAANTLPKWINVPIKQKLSDKFNVPVYLSNTANAILAAVDRYELKRQYTDVVYIEYRDGIACGIKSNGNQVLGSHGMAGELTVLGLKPNKQTHNNNGNRSTYLEQSLGFSGIHRQLKAIKHPVFIKPIQRTDMIQKILTLAAQGDETIIKILKKNWYKLGLICGSLANILDPAIIVLDPHFGQADDKSLTAIKQGIHTLTAATHTDQVEIIVSQLKEPAAPLGAALTLLDTITFNYDFS
jgi:predicted NBD/HSP70 family sugar kinase